MCSGSEAGSYLRLIEFVYHSTLGLRVIKKTKEGERFCCKRPQRFMNLRGFQHMKRWLANVMK